MVLADHLTTSAQVAGRALAVLLPLVVAGLVAGLVAVVADAALPYGTRVAGRRRRGVVALVGAAGLVVAVVVLPGHEALASWTG